MKKIYFFITVCLVCFSCTNNSTDGSSMGLKAGKDSAGIEEMNAVDREGKDKKDPDMDQHEMYNYGDSTPAKNP